MVLVDLLLVFQRVLRGVVDAKSPISTEHTAAEKHVFSKYVYNATQHNERVICIEHTRTSGLFGQWGNLDSVRTNTRRVSFCVRISASGCYPVKPLYVGYMQG
jgi:hypothetical protein